LDFFFFFLSFSHRTPPQLVARWNKVREERGKLLYQLTAVGVMVALKWSADRKSLYALLSAKAERYELQAELMRLEFALQPRYGGGFMPFVRSRKSVYLRAYTDEFFTDTQRQAILKDIINNSSFSGGANISIHKCIREGVFKKWFPFHTDTTRAFLSNTWATWKVWKWANPQPLDQMQAYFGEELTLYFAWLGFYNYALILPSLLGLAIFVAVILTTMGNEADEVGEPGTGTRATNVAGFLNTIYAGIMMIWVTLYLEFWKRYNAKLAFRWNMLNYEVSERSRPEYRGDLQFGVHSRGEWLPFDRDDETLAQLHIVPTVHSNPKWTQIKYAISMVPLALLLILVVLIVLAVLALRLYLQRTVIGPSAGGIVGSIIGAVLIIVFNIIYGKLASMLADWENHRTDSEHQDSLINKTFLFQFVNTFASLYYIAFAKRATDFSDVVSGVAKVRTLRDRCKNRFMDERGEYLQYVGEDFYARINWLPVFTRGVGKPGSLSAVDQITGVVWNYVRWDIQFLNSSVFGVDPATGANFTSIGDVVLNDNNKSRAAGHTLLRFANTTTVKEYFQRLTGLVANTGGSEEQLNETFAANLNNPWRADFDLEQIDYFRPNATSVAALNLTHEDVLLGFDARVRAVLMNEYLARFSGEDEQTMLNEQKFFNVNHVTNATDFWVGALEQRQLGAGCMSELVIQLATLMLVNMFIGQTREILLPLLMVQVKKLLVLMNLRKREETAQEAMERELKVPWEAQAKLVEFASTFDEYAEMVVQFCLVVAFAAAFPLAPLLALMNNVVEVRTDAIKIVFTNNKPHYKGAEDIGGWYRILEITGYIAVVTNMLLMLLSFSVLPIIVHGGLEFALPDVPPEASLSLRCFIFAVVLEHAMFLLKFTLAALVPDMPQDVRRDLARREFLKDELQGELDKRPHFRTPEADKAAEAGKLFSYDTDSQYVDKDSGAGRIAGDNIIMGAGLEYIIVDKVDLESHTLKASKDEKRKNKKKERREVARQESIANTDQAASDMAAAVAASAGKTAAAGLYGYDADDADAGNDNDNEAPPPPPPQ
jgi:hypothetical protein